MTRLFVISLLVIVASCSLSTQQELSLNKSINNMIEARNDGDRLSYLNHTHPAIVKHFKGLGDSLLKQKFQEVPESTSRYDFDDQYIYWGAGYVKEVMHKNTIIQAKIEIKLYENHNMIDSTVTFYATSFDDETDWLFASSTDYNAPYFPVEQRLFD